LDCLSKQIFTDFNVILIDNGSTDGCACDLEKKWAKLPLLVERWSENRGFAAANNYGARLAQGEWLACLNADAFPEPDWAQQLVKAATENKEFISFSSRLINAGAPHLLDDAGDSYHIGGLAWKRYSGYPAKQYGLHQEEVFSACAAAALYKRDPFLQVGGFDEDFFSFLEDVDLGFRLRLQGYRCLYVPKAVVAHVGSTSVGAKSDFAIYYWQRNIIWSFLKNTPSDLIWKALPAHFMANVIFAAYRILRGQIGAVRRAKVDAIRGLPKILNKRKIIQQNIKIDPSELFSVMEKGWLQPYWMAYNSRKIRRSAQSLKS
jgi:GT2 family glycosyltransferase